MRLKELRKNLGLSQSEVANHLEITQQGYANYENGKREPDNKTLLELSNFFQVSADYLLGNSDVKNQKLDIPEDVQGSMVAFNRGEFEDLTQDEVDKIAEFAQFVKSQRTN